MWDIHCHILPGVDDGARDLEMSLAMLDAARAAGVTSIVCTPHCRDPYFDYDAMWAAFRELRDHADGFPLQMGFEVAHAKLVELGVGEWAPRLCFDGGDEFLLEFSPSCTAWDFIEYERTIFELQGLGYTVIIAHPERYRAIQKDIGLAERLVKAGCLLYASAGFLAGGYFGHERRTAKRLFERDLYHGVASDAHRPEHYGCLSQAVRKFAPPNAHFDL